MLLKESFCTTSEIANIKYISSLDRIDTNNIAKRNKRMQREKKNEIAESDIKASKRDTLTNSAQNSQFESP